MATFAAHVIVHSETGPVPFAPGDELPEWAEGIVGKHCLETKAVVTDAPDFTALENAPVADAGEGEGAADSVGEVDASVVTDAPDFTAAAPRRGRPRK